jgi:alkylation response protein AidB-like acyl-CoA dehydrogenase
MMDSLARLISEVIEPQALAVDRDGTFPRAALEALGREGLLGLISAKGVGGLGQGVRAASWAVEQVGAACGSTGMALCMLFE